MRRIAVLCGGVGAARFLAGLVQVADPASVAAIVNVADDDEFHGLHVSPDIDTVLYTLGGVVEESQGWGRRDETFHAQAELARFGEDQGGDGVDVDEIGGAHSAVGWSLSVVVM
jgi:Uncharacterized conserved protein